MDPCMKAHANVPCLQDLVPSGHVLYMYKMTSHAIFRKSSQIKALVESLLHLVVAGKKKKKNMLAKLAIL